MSVACSICTFPIAAQGGLAKEVQCFRPGCGVFVRICKVCAESGEADQKLNHAMLAGLTDGQVVPLLAFHACRVTGSWSVPYTREYSLGGPASAPVYRQGMRKEVA